MPFSTDKEHPGVLARRRNVQRLYAAIALVITLGVWIAVASVAASNQNDLRAHRRLLFIPRYSWPTAPPGPAGCLLPIRAICTAWGTRYPPDIFTAVTGSY